MSTFADKLFDATYTLNNLEGDLLDILVDEIFGWADEWQFSDATWDPYDSSLELKECLPDFRVSLDQAEKIFALGFLRFWVNYTNNTEAYFFKAPAEIRIAWKHKSNLCSWIQEPKIPWTEDQEILPDEVSNKAYRDRMEVKLI